MGEIVNDDGWEPATPPYSYLSLVAENARKQNPLVAENVNKQENLCMKTSASTNKQKNSGKKPSTSANNHKSPPCPNPQSQSPANNHKNPWRKPTSSGTLVDVLDGSWPDLSPLLEPIPTTSPEGEVFPEAVAATARDNVAEQQAGKVETVPPREPEPVAEKQSGKDAAFRATAEEFVAEQQPGKEETIPAATPESEIEKQLDKDETVSTATTGPVNEQQSSENFNIPVSAPKPLNLSSGPYHLPYPICCPNCGFLWDFDSTHDKQNSPYTTANAVGPDHHEQPYQVQPPSAPSSVSSSNDLGSPNRLQEETCSAEADRP